MESIFNKRLLEAQKQLGLVKGSSQELIKSIKRQHEILNADGIICHSFWKGEGSEVFKGLFVNYHSKTSITNFYQEHFEILYIEDYMEFEKGDSILLIAKKK